MLATQPLLAAAKPCGARRGRSACRSPAPLGGSYARIRSHGSPCGLVVPPSARASGFRALRAPWRRPRLFYRCAQKQLGAPALIPSHSRRAADRSAAPTPSRDAPAKPRTTRRGEWWRLRRSSLAPSRRRPPGAAAVPSQAAPPLALGARCVEAARRSSRRCLRRIRQARVTGALHEAERKRSSLVRRTT